MKPRLSHLLAGITGAALTLTIAATRTPEPQAGRYQLTASPGYLPMLCDTTTAQTWILQARQTNSLWLPLHNPTTK